MKISDNTKQLLQEMASYLILISILVSIQTVINNALIKNHSKKAVESVIERQKDLDRTFIIKQQTHYLIESESEDNDTISFFLYDGR